jgi:hypothetical protein
VAAVVEVLHGEGQRMEEAREQEARRLRRQLRRLKRV